MSAILTNWTPLRRMVDERGIWPIIAELVDIAGELEEHATGDENEKWTRVGIALRSAREHADEHSDGLKEGV